MMVGKNALISSSLKYFFRSTACGARIPCQITSTMNTSTSPLLAAQYCGYSWSVAEASFGRLMYSTLLPVFWAHSSANGPGPTAAFSDVRVAGKPDCGAENGWSNQRSYDKGAEPSKGISPKRV